jgi:hypothetical protein
MRGRQAKVIALLTFLAVLALAALARAEVAQEGTLRVAVTGKLSPRSLPRSGGAPIAVSVGWQIATTDKSVPPDLKTLRIEINRNGHLDYTGLPVCPYDRIQPATSARALANCHSALVGEGRFSAIIGLEGQETYAVDGRLLVFNGSRHGKPVLLGQIYSPHPFATSFVITFKVGTIARGAYGTALTATLPKALGSWGSLTGIEMTLSRRYRYGGERRSYLTAACPAPKGFTRAVFPMARTSFSFAGGSSLSTTLSRVCRAHG